MLLFTNGKEVIVMNRHKKPLAHKLDIEELRSLYVRGSGEWMVLVGEYMNKNKKDETGKSWNHKFVIFDILVYDGDYMVGTSFKFRSILLEKLYPKSSIKKPYLSKISENCYRVLSMVEGFKDIYDKITIYDMYEGLVLKRIDGKLEMGTSPKNNTRTQLKCRKPTKNYSY